ncbi:hypothetical protein QE422_003353 [Chryseobacterium sp. SORGH_AS 447]|nr:hypothetical protein [Chryseobacterium sp. SORGH_AS_0447]
MHYYPEKSVVKNLVPFRTKMIYIAVILPGCTRCYCCNTLSGLKIIPQLKLTLKRDDIRYYAEKSVVKNLAPLGLK